MDETVTHVHLTNDDAAELSRCLRQIDAKKLTFVQLRRLQGQLKHANDEFEREATSRASEDASGDTVRVPSPATD